jgi:uncharacterized heparinase superfamily protein
MNKQKNEYNSIVEVEARLDEIRTTVAALAKEARHLQSVINTMNDCNLQNSYTNQPDQH